MSTISTGTPFPSGAKTRVPFLGEVRSVAEMVARVKRATMKRRVVRGKRLLELYDQGYRPPETGMRRPGEA